MIEYKAEVSRSGKWWYIAVPQAGPMAMTQARRLSEVDFMARDLVANLKNVEPNSFTVKVVMADAEFAKAKSAVALARTAAQEAQKIASDKTTHAAQDLVKQGLPVRDIAALLDVSPSWVSALTKAA